MHKNLIISVIIALIIFIGSMVWLKSNIQKAPMPLFFEDEKSIDILSRDLQDTVEDDATVTEIGATLDDVVTDETSQAGGSVLTNGTAEITQEEKNIDFSQSLDEISAGDAIEKDTDQAVIDISQ
ncbi:MAG: hypothetical protein HY453_02210 [Parcubacteria group bacterium]|nr:hypothetical protein [Parcubacteria group bacterium]